MCFTVFKPLAREKRSFLFCLGRYGSKEQSCHVPGPSWLQNHPKSVPKASLLLYLLVCWFEGRVFFAFCVVF